MTEKQPQPKILQELEQKIKSYADYSQVIIVLNIQSELLNLIAENIKIINGKLK